MSHGSRALENSLRRELRDLRAYVERLLKPVEIYVQLEMTADTDYTGTGYTTLTALFDIVINVRGVVFTRDDTLTNPRSFSYNDSTGAVVLSEAPYVNGVENPPAAPEKETYILIAKQAKS